jgi:hypothetical protein
MHRSSDSKKTIILWKLQPGVYYKPLLLQPLAWIILNNVTVAKSSTPTHCILQGRVLFVLQVDATWFAWQLTFKLVSNKTCLLYAQDEYTVKCTFHLQVNSFLVASCCKNCLVSHFHKHLEHKLISTFQASQVCLLWLLSCRCDGSKASLTRT